MNKAYGFEGECKAKYSSSLFQYFAELFNTMPLGYVIENKVFVCHGGLCSSTPTIAELKQINRFSQPRPDSLFSQLLWSDPSEKSGINPSKRGAGISFGPDITSDFCSKNNLELVVRSHEVKEEGYEITHDKKLITVFSAPNYVDQMGNKGAIVQLSFSKTPNTTPVSDLGIVGGMNVWIEQFVAVPHPNIRPMAYASNLSQMQ
eukprot:NODE_174_length_15906_cov_0.510533.p9 type:complete len:204 gc:universal NODE_174_length_15906_cov_0.510533:1725-2336(+)